MLINKIKNSQKINIIISFLKQTPFYLADIITLLYCIFYNLVFHQKVYDKKFVIVTGSDNYFSETLIQLLNNLISYKFINEIHVYDLGMDDDIVAKVKSISPDINVFKFQFSQYEEFISKRDSYGTLGAYAWKPNIIWKELETTKSKVIWLDSANLINYRFIFVLIILTAKGFFSPISAMRVKDLTYKTTIKSLDLPDKYLNKRNLTGGFVGFDWNNSKSRELAKMWVDNSNIEELVLPKDSNKYNHRWDQSILTVLTYKQNNFGYLPKMKKVFGIKVNQNPNQDFFLFYSGSNKKKIDFYNNWYKNNKNISTKTIRYSKIIWLLEWESYKGIPNKYLNSRKILCQIESIDDLEEIKELNLDKKVSIFLTQNNELKEIIEEKYGDQYICKLLNTDTNKLRLDILEIKKTLI